MDKDKLPKECRLCTSQNVIIKDYKEHQGFKIFLSTCQNCWHEDLIITKKIGPSQ